MDNEFMAYVEAAVNNKPVTQENTTSQGDGLSQSQEISQDHSTGKSLQKDEGAVPGPQTQRQHPNYQTDERGVKRWQMKQPAVHQHTPPAYLGLVETDIKVGYADQVLVELQKVLESSKVELDTLLKRANHMQEVCAVIEAQINGIKSLKG